MSDAIDRPPRASISDFLPLPDPPRQFSLDFIQGCSAIKLREGAEAVDIGVCDPHDLVLQENLRAFHRKMVRFFEIDRSDLALHLGRLRGAATVTSEPDPTVRRAQEEKLLLDRLANDAPVVNLVNAILIEGIRAGASDVHVESFAEDMVVRHRVDGTLRRARTLPPSMFPAVSSRIKIMANLNIMERRLPQDGRLTVHLDADRLDVRVSIMPIADGESLVLRLLRPDSAPMALEQLGFGARDLALLQRLTRLPHGLVLATGPTGSGKTTTLNAVLRGIDASARKVVTIEDPIEYRLPGIDQVQTNEHIGLTFESILRRVLRQDPNVIMVGEIRDTETAQLAIRAALTGHLVLSTLHTADSVSAITRLRNLGVPGYLIAAVLRAVVAQRLVRRTCPRCRRRLRPEGRDLALLRANGLHTRWLYRGRGCPACDATGYRGRLALVEMFTVDGEVERMIMDGVPATEVARYLQGRGMASLLADGLAKAVRGETSLEEIERTGMLS